MKLQNVPVATVPEGVTTGIDLAVRAERNKPTKSSAMRMKMTAKKAQELFPDDFHLLTACLLGRFKLLTRNDLEAIYLHLARGGCEGVLASLQEEFGLSFDVLAAVGQLQKKMAARNKLSRACKNGGFRVLEPSAANVKVKSEMYDEGLAPFVCLTRKGARAMVFLAKQNGKKLTQKDIQFPPDETAVALPKWLHERQVADLIALTMVGACLNSDNTLDAFNRADCNLKELKTEVVLKFNAGGRERFFKPDLAAELKYVIGGAKGTHTRTLQFYLEHDTTSNTRAAISRKIENYLMLIINDSGLQTNAPYLLLTTSSEARMQNTVEPAVREALKAVIDQMFVDYTETFGHLACATFDDLALTTWGSGEQGVWRKWDFATGVFSAEKKTLPTLGAKAVCRVS